MTKKVNGFSASGQFLTGGLNFYKLVTTLDIRPDTAKVGKDEFGYYEPTESQKRLDKVIETISLRAQPVILSAVVPGVATADDAAKIDVAVGATVYTLSFAIEHNQAWEVQGSANPTLSESLDGIMGFVHDIAVTDDNNVVVGIVETL